MPKKKPTDLVLDESVIREAEMARTLDEQFEEGYAALQPIPEEQLPLTAARMLYYLGALWGFLKRLKPEDLAPDYEMTVEELSAFLPEKPAVQTIYGWVSEEKIPYIKRGKRLFFVKRAIIRWNTGGRPVNPDNITEIAQAYVANNRPARGNAADPWTADSPKRTSSPRRSTDPMYIPTSFGSSTRPTS